MEAGATSNGSWPTSSIPSRSTSSMEFDGSFHGSTVDGSGWKRLEASMEGNRWKMSMEEHGGRRE